MKTNNLAGIFLMLGGMAFLSSGDLFLKLSAQQLPTGEVMLVMGMGSALIYLMLIWLAGEKISHPIMASHLFTLRLAGEMIAGLGLFIALVHTPLSLVAAILQMLPLTITLGAALFLGERVGPHRIVSILAGFAGVMLIIRPGGASFDPYVMFALMAVIGMTIRDIVTRKMTGWTEARLITGVSSRQLSFYSAFCLGIMGAGMLLVTGGGQLPQPMTGLMLAGMVGMASVGYFMVTHATRIAELSVISPYRYSRLLFSLLLGWIILNEQADGAMLAGAGLVILAGIYIWIRERRQLAGG